MHLPLPKIDTHFLECKGKDSLTPPVTFFVYWGRGMWVTLVPVTPPPSSWCCLFSPRFYRLVSHFRTFSPRFPPALLRWSFRTCLLFFTTYNLQTSNSFPWMLTKSIMGVNYTLSSFLVTALQLVQFLVTHLSEKMLVSCGWVHRYYTQ